MKARNCSVPFDDFYAGVFGGRDSFPWQSALANRVIENGWPANLSIPTACGKTDIHSLEPEDLCALTVEAAAMAKVPLAGTEYIPGVTEDRTLQEMKQMLESHLEGQAQQFVGQPGNTVAAQD